VTVLYGLTIAIAALGVIIAGFALGLGDTQKEKLRDDAIRFWNWLDDAKTYSLLDWLRRYYRWIVGSALILECAYVAWIVLSAMALNTGGAVTTLLIGLIIAALSFLLGLKIIKTILRARSLGRAFLGATLLLAVSLLPIVALFALAPAFSRSVLPSLLTSQPTLWIALLQLLTIFGYVLSVHCTLIVLIFWAAIAIPVVFIYSLSCLLYMSELIIRRLAERPNSLLVASTLLGAIATFLKVLDRH
jgi:hypothetical protein